MEFIKNNDRIILHIESDGYDENKFKTEFLDKKIKFDFMLDDGPHTLDSMNQFIETYDLRHIKGRYDDIVVFVINKSSIK
jgi:hypothetical protein